jgi:hypothetical protein
VKIKLLADAHPTFSYLQGLIDSWCKPWGNGEANLLKLLESWTFSVASVIMLDGAARIERFVSRSLRVTACRRRHFAPRANQTPPRRLLTVGVSRLRASGAIKLEEQQAVIPFGGKQKLLSLAHTTFKNGGSWSYFRCPKCGGRARKLWLVADAPRCKNCCSSLGVRYRSAYAFGRSDRLKERDHRVDKLQAMLDGGPLRLKPPPPNWGARRLDRRYRLTWTLRRASIVTRLAEFAYQGQSGTPDETLPLLRAYKPTAAATEAIPDLRSLWRSGSVEELEQALDKAQVVVLEALHSKDFRTRLRAAKLMLRTRAARERGLS